MQTIENNITAFKAAFKQARNGNGPLNCQLIRDEEVTTITGGAVLGQIFYLIHRDELGDANFIRVLPTDTITIFE
jgi:hypothetical protein